MQAQGSRAPTALHKGLLALLALLFVIGQIPNRCCLLGCDCSTPASESSPSKKSCCAGESSKAEDESAKAEDTSGGIIAHSTGVGCQCDVGAPVLPTKLSRKLASFSSERTHLPSLTEAIPVSRAAFATNPHLVRIRPLELRALTPTLILLSSLRI